MEGQAVSEHIADRDFTLLALHEILVKALAAIAYVASCEYGGDADPWEHEFTLMSHDDQAWWLIELFQELSEGDMRQLDDILPQNGEEDA
jgi:hypothetical protein